MLYSRLVKENIMYTVEKLEGNKYEIKIDLSKDEFEKFIEEAYETSKDKFSVQGFRKGKAPRKVIEKNYGANIFVDDALDLAFNRLYGQALDEHREIDPISSPEIKLDKFDDTGLTITAVVENMPEVKLGAYTGLEIEGAKGEVTEEKIEKEINQTRERQARFVPTDREARLGDFVEIDFVGSINGVKFDGGEAKNYRLELGSKSFIDNFEDQLVGMKKGEIRSDKGELLGEHDGVFYYTLGQRRGLGIGGVDGAEDGRWFVVGKDVTGNVLYVSQSESALYRSALECDAFNFISGEPDADEFDCMARIRHRQPLQKARAKRIGDGVRLEFERPQRAIAAGQYAVIYDGEECLGGGQIERADDSGNR